MQHSSRPITIASASTQRSATHSLIIPNPVPPQAGEIQQCPDCIHQAGSGRGKAGEAADVAPGSARPRPI
jgi:hypothetical protein